MFSEEWLFLSLCGVALLFIFVVWTGNDLAVVIFGYVLKSYIVLVVLVVVSELYRSEKLGKLLPEEWLLLPLCGLALLFIFGFWTGNEFAVAIYGFLLKSYLVFIGLVVLSELCRSAKQETVVGGA